MQKDYASEIADKLSALGLYADVDNGADTLPKKIRNGEIAQYNFILGTSLIIICKKTHANEIVIVLCTVVGQEELDSRSVNVRNRDDVGSKAKTEMIPLEDLAKKLVQLKETKSLHNKLP